MIRISLTEEERRNLAKHLQKTLTPEDAEIMLQNHLRWEMHSKAGREDTEGPEIGVSYYVMCTSPDDGDPELYDECSSYARAMISASQSSRYCWITTQPPRW